MRLTRFFASSALLVLSVCSAQAAPLSQEPSRVLYQIYVESFRDGSTFEGLEPAGSGNFDGLRHSLGYLKGLGVTGVLLMPIFESGGMGYIPDDFFLIRGSYSNGGTAGQRARNFQLFTRAAHEAGIKVFLDAPINHISDGSAWFTKSARRIDGFDDWFLWAPKPRAGWRRPWQANSVPSDVWYPNAERDEHFYGLFSAGMPDLNHRNPAVTATFERFFELYAGLGADGFRIDAAKHIVEGENDNTDAANPDNIARVRGYLDALRARFPDQSFILEIWAGHREIDPYLPKAGDVALDFPFMETLRASLEAESARYIRETLRHYETTQDAIGPGSRILFMGNHDVPRIRTFLRDRREPADLAMALTFSLPQIPMMYYGDELFMPGDYTRDERGWTKDNQVCTPMAWNTEPNAGFTAASVKLGDEWNRKLHEGWQKLNVETELADPASMLNTVRQLIAARKSLPITANTRIAVKNAQNDPVLTVGMKFEDGSCTVALYNFSASAQRARFASLPGFCPATCRSSVLFSKRVSGDVARGCGIVADLDGHGVHWVRYH